jgi:hypothetical protein
MEEPKEDRSKIYNTNYFNKHKEQTYKCDLCEKEVSFFNKYHHIATQKHKLAQRIADKYKL